MQLPFLKNRQEQKNFFLSLLIKPNKIGAILFEEINNKLFILATHETATMGDTENLDVSGLLQASDRVITKVEASLPAGGSVEKTIFSVPYDWIDEGKIKENFLAKLKRLCQELGLQPVGYLTSIEAIVHLIEKKEGAPVSALFVEAGENHVYSYVVRGGKILEFVSGEKTDREIAISVENLFKKIQSVDVLPSKIILADYDGAESLQQKFLSHKWAKDIPFLHLPQVVVLDKGFENEAVVNGVASQMDLEVLSDVRIQEKEEPVEVLEETKGSEFGFVKGKDLADEELEEIEPDEKPESIEGLENIDSDLTEANFTKHSDNDNDSEEVPDVSYFKEEDKSKIDQPSVEEDEEHDSNTKKIAIPAALTALLQNFKGMKMPVLSGSAKSSLLKPKLIVAVIALIAVIGIISLLYYNVILRAEVTIFADQKAIDKTEDVIFATDTSEDNSIPLQILKEEVKGEETKNSSGTKETGEKAKGAVTVYNKTEDKKTFVKGTILVGPNSLEFEITEDINVASTSSFSTSLSSVNAKVQAAKIGKEYNLPSGSNFTVKGFSSSNYIGKNSEAITGGSKKTSTVVSEKDLEDLLSQIEKGLEKDALASAKSKVSSDEELIPASLGSEVNDEKYTRKVGDEAGSVGISATVAYSIGKYNKSDVDSFVKNLSQSEVPGTYALLAPESTTEIENIKVSKDGESASAKLKIHAVYAPEIKIEELTAGLKSKSKSSSIEQIKKIGGITDVNIVFKNTLPLFPELLPANPKNIKIEIRK